MKQPNEIPVEKIASLEARIQQKNMEKIGIREKMMQFQTQKRQFEVKYQTEKQQLDIKFQPQKQQLAIMNNELKSANNTWEMDIGKLRTELKALKNRGNHCIRHPRMLAGLRVDCTGGQQQEGHLLCIGCVRSWSNLGKCPFCQKPVKGGEIKASELEQLVGKLVADKKMMRPDSFLPLPFELNAEIWEFAKKNLRFVICGNNRWENRASSIADKLEFLSDDGLSVCKENRIDNSSHIWSTVRAVKPFCVLKAALIDHCLPDIFYFEVLVKKGHIYIGLSDPEFPLSEDTYVGGEAGSYSFNTWATYNAHNFKQKYKDEKGWYAIGGNVCRPDQNKWTILSQADGDVAGCGLLLSPNRQHKLFFTKNGQLFCKPFLLPAMDNNQVVFPTVTLTSDTSIVANFGDDPERPFCYKFRKQNLSKKERKRLKKLQRRREKKRRID